ncbi:GTP cyclohydrolase I [Wolffia australiana]
MGALGECCLGGEMGCLGMEQMLLLGGDEQEMRDEQEMEIGGCIEVAVRALLQGLGEDPDRDGLKKTPLRVAKALREGTRGYKETALDIVEGALFLEPGMSSRLENAKGRGGLVVVRNIALFSHCESCLLPFRVQCHVGYVPSGKHVVGLSKLARVANVFAKRLQDPQRLADEICSALEITIKPLGVAVSLQCCHVHLPELGKKNPNSQNWQALDVLSYSGIFEDKDGDPWVEFSAVLKLGGINVGRQEKPFSPHHSWCPLLKPQPKLDKALPEAMVSAATSIIASLGEDPLRKELLGTPHRFVRWLLTFKRASFELKHYSGDSGLQNGLLGITREKHDGFLSELSLPFCSQCEHHLLPFYGVAHIGYIASRESAQLIERSLLHSIVLFYGCKLQVQERLTKQIAETVFSISGGGVMVVVEADHVCMASRGIEKMGSSTATTAAMGHFASNPEVKNLFLQSIINSRASGR